MSVYGDQESDFLPVTSEVSQGTILGPLVLSNFTNDIPNVISRETSLSLFADDSKCFCLVLSQDNNKLQDDLDELFRQPCTWGMDFNVAKCKLLRVVCIKSVFNRDYFLGEVKLECMNFLKISWCLHVSWNNHVDYICPKLQKYLICFIIHAKI